VTTLAYPVAADHIELPEIWTPGQLGQEILDQIWRPTSRALGRAKDAIISYMSPGLADTAEVDVLDSIFGDHASIQLYTAPVFLALTTAAVAETSTGSTLTEANYTGYARLSVSAANMNAASAGAKANGATLTFANCTAGSSVVIGWATCTASSAGNVIVYGTCTSTTISTTQTPASVASGGLSVTLD
jgi:hypothetical protein